MPQNTSKKPFYISTSIAYVNGEPHVGFAMESIEADVLARWARKQGRETFFCTGTDEHGEKIQKTADSQNTTPQEICDTNAQRFKELGKALNISNDAFIRTSDKKVHWPSVQELWSKLVEKGDIEKRTYTANYCYGCELFLTDKELDENGHCPNHLRAPETISEENYFFLLSKYSEKIAELIETDTLKIVPSFRKNEILQMAKGGFFDVSFSRPSKKLPWGVPVPEDSTQNMYVWCDALTNYISVLDYKNNSEQFQKFWNNGEGVHVIGKDILRFHAGIWIGMLLSAEIKLPDKIFVHGFLTSEGHKMSKSIGNVVDPFGEVERYGTDALRYFLLREVPVGQDADFSRQRFEEIYQAHLANGLGNLTSRVLTLAKKGNISMNKSEWKPNTFLEQTNAQLIQEMNNFSLHSAIETLFSVVDYCDKRINETKPWEIAKTNPKANEVFIQEMLQALEYIAENISVFLPETGEKLLSSLNDIHGDIPMLFPRLEKMDLQAEENSRVLVPKDVQLTISPEVEKMGIHIEHTVLQNVSVKKTPKGIQKFCKLQAKEFLENRGVQNHEWRERIDTADAIKTSLGFSPETYPNAALSLGNLVEKNGKLPSFTNIVDLYNIISLKHGVSAGAHDCMFLDTEVRMDTVNGDEAFEPMTGKENLNTENNPLQKGEYAFFISDTEIGCRFDSAQCEKSKITEGNKNILIYFQAPKENKQWAVDAMEEFMSLLNQYKII